MCGRFTLTVDPADLQDVFADFIFPTQFAPRYNIAPTQPVLAIPNDGKNKADFFLWGLIPSWSKDPAIANKLINARGETVAEKPSFRGSFKYKRCLIPADGFYEWKAQADANAKTKTQEIRISFLLCIQHHGYSCVGVLGPLHTTTGAHPTRRIPPLAKKDIPAFI